MRQSPCRLAFAGAFFAACVACTASLAAGRQQLPPPGSYKLLRIMHMPDGPVLSASRPRERTEREYLGSHHAANLLLFHLRRSGRLPGRVVSVPGRTRTGERRSGAFRQGAAGVYEPGSRARHAKHNGLVPAVLWRGERGSAMALSYQPVRRRTGSAPRRRRAGNQQNPDRRGSARSTIC